MPDHAVSGLPRIALAYGQEAAVEHVREAVSGHVEVVYAAPASEFDVARMAGAQAMAALVNLDDGDWLDALEARLYEAGTTVVYNDPEISRGLDGWERARWLRHLVAKLSGNPDVDPPRPEPAESGVSPAAVAAVAENEPTPAAAPLDANLAELPPSPEEIETMTIDLIARQNPPAAAAVERPVAMSALADVMAMDQAVEEAAASAARAGEPESEDAETTAHVLPVASVDNDFDAEAALDVDTETLSAMIDARLAEPQAGPSSDSAQVWRVLGDAVVPAQAEAEAREATDETAPPVTVEPAAPVLDDADVLASLPSLDDWQLVDPESPVAKVKADGAGKTSEPVLPDSLAGLELVPMETIIPVSIHTDPIERWLHDSETTSPRPDAAKTGGAKA
ncbi:MAG: hypothetical protein JSR56_09120 [Proteobacteria bacterium]|nr:hypothetical protein [Pseudomonadota bacterium]